MLIGSISGAILCGSWPFNSIGGTGFLFGAFFGLLLAKISQFRKRLDTLEQEIGQIMLEQSLKQTKATLAEAAQKNAPQPNATSIKPEPTPTPFGDPLSATTEKTTISDNPKLESVEVATAQPIATPIPSLDPLDTNEQPKQTKTYHAYEPTSAHVYEPTAIDKAISYLKHWFTEGNIPVKIGVLVLFGGVAALLRYAATQGWFTFPIELRLVGIAASALAALMFAWRKRESHRAFSLSLQGGAIGVLVLTIFAAFRLYHLLPASAAFALLIILIAGTGVLAVLQNAMALAFMGIVGGFLAPILISTGSGNHVVLFSYYAILNMTILGIAWIKPWRILNLVGFTFTFVIGTAWGALRYQPELFNSTEPFLVLFFLFYLAIPVLYAIRQPTEKRGLVDGSLVFGTPLLAFPLQAALLHPDQMALAYSALVAALIYTCLAWLLLRRLNLRVLGESFALLAVGFATLAVPLALSAQSTACVWALEGAGLVWLGLRQNRRVPRWLGYLLQLLAGIAYLFSIRTTPAIDAQPVLNGDFLGAILISLAGFTSARLLKKAAAHAPIASLLFIWGLAWWYFTGLQEINRFAGNDLRFEWLFSFISITALLASILLSRWKWDECALAIVLIFPAALPMILLTTHYPQGPLEGYAALAWGIWFLSALHSLSSLQKTNTSGLTILHFIFVWAIVLLLGFEFAYLCKQRFNLTTIWIVIASLIPMVLSFILGLKNNPFLTYPIGQESAAKQRTVLMSTFALVMAGVASFALLAEGQPTPLRYIPILNPLELGQLLLLTLLLRWYQQSIQQGLSSTSTEQRTSLFGLLSVLLLTSITLRSVHFIAGVPWSSALFSSPLAQASLSIIWSLAGIIAMIVGARRASRSLWIGGASLMGVVIFKLILIDRQHLQDLPAILGTLAVGLLLLIVGYFAPVPPRQKQESTV